MKLADLKWRGDWRQAEALINADWRVWRFAGGTYDFWCLSNPRKDTVDHDALAAQCILLEILKEGGDAS